MSFSIGLSKFYFTETALLRIYNDLLLASNRKEVSALVLLDLSAAFDTIDHQILLNRLKTFFGFSGSSLSIIESYLSNRFQHVTIDNHSSVPLQITTGVPQGSVLGPLLFHFIPLQSVIFSLVPKSNFIYMLTTLNSTFPFPVLIP